MDLELQSALAGALTGRYDLVREIGRGGMATVWLATDRKHDRRVAIKVMHPESLAAVGAERFLREVRLVARLQHPHILPLYDSGDAAGALYFVMPYVEGESLRQRLARDGALALDECARLLRHVADGLDYAHERGVVHRDLKPDNILVVDGQALLADFGIAVAAGGGAPGDLTTAALRLGTPAYMSPEQAAGDPGLDRRSDIYSLGCTCYELLAGVPPFRGPSVMSVISQHMVAPPPPLTGARHPLPPCVGDAITRALAKDPGDRFGSAGELAAQLERGLLELRGASPPDVRIRAIERRLAARQGVLVLDFANITGAADAEWLSVGIAESVGADLGKVAGLKRVPLDAAARKRLASELPPGQCADPAAALGAGRAAGADWVVWGGYQMAGSNVRLTSYVGSVATGETTAVETVDGTMHDIFVLQDRIVTAVAGVLQVRLTGADEERARRPEAARLTAYEHYARGFRAYLQFGKESAKTAERHYRAAIAADPDYALAYAGLGALHITMYVSSGRRDVLDAGTEFLERAIALDPTLSESYGWLSYMLTRQHRFGDAERAARHAIELDPANFTNWYMLGLARAVSALTTYRPETLARAVPPLLRTVALRPEHFSAYLVLVSIYMLRGAYGHAVRAVDAALRRELTEGSARFAGALVQRGVLHLGAGEHERAGEVLDRAIERYASADHAYAEAILAYAYWARGCVAERAGLPHAALAQFGRACEVAEAAPSQISIGAHWVKARARAAGVMHALGRRVEAERALAQARSVFDLRERFVWTWYMGAADGDVLYETAAALAGMGRDDEAIDVLRRAGDAGWADVTRLRHDPAFETLRDSDEVRRLCADAAGRVTLPAPIGEGGLE